MDSIYGPTKNVWGSPMERALKGEDTAGEEYTFNDWRIAGGSSGGSAIAVATGSVFALVYTEAPPRRSIVGSFSIFL